MEAGADLWAGGRLGPCQPSESGEAQHESIAQGVPPFNDEERQTARVLYIRNPDIDPQEEVLCGLLLLSRSVSPERN